MAGVKRQTFWNWRTYYENFPKPIAELTAGPIWDKEEMATWIKSHQEARKTLQRRKKKKGPAK